jgi:hypothetical protein
VSRLGYALVERIGLATVANATSVAALVLLGGAAGRACCATSWSPG